MLTTKIAGEKGKKILVKNVRTRKFDVTVVYYIVPFIFLNIFYRSMMKLIQRN